MKRIGDDRALWLARCVLPHEPELRSWLHSRRVAGLEVDDIIQETYARLAATQNIAGIQNPRAYAFSTAYSVILAHIRRARVVSFEAMVDLDELGAVAEDPSPETEVADRQDLRRLAEAIAALPERPRQVFHLRRVEGLTQKAVAERLGLSESTVEKHIGKALMLLMERFGRGGNRGARASRLSVGKKQKGDGQRDRARD